MMGVFGGTGMLVAMLFWSVLLTLLLWALASVVRSERQTEKARVLSEEDTRVRRTR